MPILFRIIFANANFYITKVTGSAASVFSQMQMSLHFYTVQHEGPSSKDTLLLTHKQVRERYAERSNDPSEREVRVHEVEMQTLLRMEMESVEPTDIAAVKKEEKEKKREEREKDDDDDDEIDLPEALQDSVDEVIYPYIFMPPLRSSRRHYVFGLSVRPSVRTSVRTYVPFS